MRHDATPGYPNDKKFGRSFDAVLPILTKAYREVTEYAEQKGVKTCIENHGFFAQDAERVEKLINAVGHPNFGALVDIGNFACADEDSPLGRHYVAVCLPFACEGFPLKKNGSLDNPAEGWFQSRACNYLRGSIIGHGDVPVRQCINALRRGGYDGYMMIEFEGMEDPIRGITVGYNNLKRFIG